MHILEEGYDMRRGVESMSTGVRKLEYVQEGRAAQADCPDIRYMQGDGRKRWLNYCFTQGQSSFFICT